MLSFTEIRKGKTIVLDGEPYVVTSSSFMRKQQARPVMRTQLKHIKSGQTKEHTFQQSDKVEEADVQQIPHQFLYASGDVYTFMNMETFDQVELDADAAQDVSRFFIEGESVDITMFEGKVVGVHLPIKIDRKVIEAPPGVKGDTSTNVTKEVTVEGGARLRAPLFIKEGDVIRIDTRTGEYIERA